MERFTHFMCEMEHRGLDWRQIPEPDLKGLVDPKPPV
jgi:hypothetical protein